MLYRYKKDLRFLNNNCIFATIIRPQTETKISHSITIDKNVTDSQRLIKWGGRLAAFIPVTDEQVLEEMLPSQGLIEKAGFEFESSREQPLNDKLSRWLVCYVAIKKIFDF